MAYIGIQPAEKFTSFATQEFSTSATTSYTLDHAVANENEIALFVNNVRQQPGSGKAYTATGTALTLSAATASTDTMYCIFLGRALQTVVPATNSITAAMVGNDLISGKDALTSAPASTDEFLVSDAGTLKRIDASLVGRGKLLQVVTATTGTNTNTNSTSFVATSLTADITPSASSSKIFVIANSDLDSQDQARQAYATIYRDSTNLASGTDNLANNYGAGTRIITPVSMSVLDSPSSTSQLTYKVYVKGSNADTTLKFNNQDILGTITLMEIAG